MGLLLFSFCTLAARRNLIRISWQFFQWAARVTGLFRVEIDEASRRALSQAHGIIIAANHLTLIDIVILVANLPPSTAIAKSAAAHNPFYAAIVRGAFLINDEAQAILDEASRLLSSGINLIIFPEGTRIPFGQREHKLARGAAQIALRTKVPILPIVITCDPPVLAKSQPWWDVGSRTVRFSLTARELINPAGEPTRHAATELTNRIAKALFA